MADGAPHEGKVPPPAITDYVSYPAPGGPTECTTAAGLVTALARHLHWQFVNFDWSLRAKGVPYPALNDGIAKTADQLLDALKLAGEARSTVDLATLMQGAAADVENDLALAGP